MPVTRISLLLLLLVCRTLGSLPCEPGYGGDYEGGCEICQPGSYDAGYGFCAPCFPGTFQEEAGQTECNFCPQGTHSRYNAIECVSCPEGQTLMDTNACGTCPAGQYYSNDGGYCAECENGFFKAEVGLGPCMPCPRNTFSRREATECVPCPEGKALLRNGSCATCPPGKFYDDYSFECRDCYADTYTHSPNVLRNCYQCGGNSFAVPGSSKCMECPVGKVLIRSSETCERCEPGQFYDGYEQSCTDCPYNQYSLYESERICRSCMPGTFARRGSNTCFACPRGQFYIAERDDCGICSPGDYYDAYDAACH